MTLIAIENLIDNASDADAKTSFWGKTWGRNTILSWLWHFFGVIFSSSFMYHGYYSNLKRLEILIYILFEFKHSYNFFILRRLFVKHKFLEWDFQRQD